MDEELDFRHGLKLLRSAGFEPDAILDIGAHRGDWARMVRPIFPSAHIFMIEAQGALLAELGRAAIEVGNSAVSITLLGAAKRDDATFYQMAIEMTAGSSIYPEQSNLPRVAQRLPMHRLDDIVARDFQLLKLDVQGAELDILKGAPKTLANVECVVMEISSVEYNKGAPSFAAVIATMDALGYSLFDIFPFGRQKGGLLIAVDAVFLHKKSRFQPRPPFL